MAELLHFPENDAAKLESYLPPPRLPGLPAASPPQGDRPFVSLTFAMSLDSSLALAPGMRTALSGPQSKAMTHYLRSRHDAILVGVGTAVADDPGLNCRIAGGYGSGEDGRAHQPRPIVLDPHDRWPLTYGSRVLATARSGLGLAPYVLTSKCEPDATKRQLLESHGGKYISLDTAPDFESGTRVARFTWKDILASVAGQGLNSVMIEGGASVINTLLEPINSILVDSVIITIAPTWLGRGGVVVSPNRVYSTENQTTAAARLSDVSWQQLGEDVILCGRFST